MNTAVEQQILAEITMIRRRLDEMAQAGKPGYTQTEFARRAKISVRTVERLVANKTIRLQHGKVPHKYLAERLS